MSYEINEPHGKRVLARGVGIENMGWVCWERHLTSDNSVLVVDDPSDLDSTWTIYEPLRKGD